MKKIHKRLAITILILIMELVIIVPAQAKEEKAPVNDKLAIVNGVVITKAAFDNELGIFEKQISIQGGEITEEERVELKSRIMENLINQELLFQECQKQGIEVEQSAIDQSFSELRSKFNTDAEFTNALTGMNLTMEELQSKIKRNLAAQKLIDTKVRDNVQVSEKENKTFYDGHPDYFKQPEQVRVGHMLIRLEGDADDKKKSEAMEMMKKVLVRIKKGGDFDEIAKEYSESSIKPESVDLGYFSRGQMIKPIEDAAFILKTGETSDIMTTEHGLHILKLLDKKPESVIDYAEVKEKIAQYLKQENIKQGVNSYIQGLKKNAKIEKMM